MLKAIVFDFDGVILESIAVKKDAFRRLFQDSDQVDSIVQYHMDNGGLSRFRKFEYIYKNFLREPLTPDRSEELGQLFRDYALEGVLAAKFVEGAEDFLHKHYQRLPLFIASGTPHEEMLEVVDKRNLKPYFCDVFGSPASKAEILNRIMADHGFMADEMIFVGDATTDYHGAKEANVAFIGRVDPEYGNPFEGKETRGLIRDLNELDQLIESEFQVAG